MKIIYPEFINCKQADHLESGLTTYSDMISGWYNKRLEEYGEQLIVHRKQWEIMSCLQCINENNMLREGKKGLVFGVGKEVLPSMFASKGVDILASDAPEELSGTSGWNDTNQYSNNKEQLFYENKVTKELFDKHVSFTTIDMNAIPEYLHGQFDFVWSICALEHLGSIEKGLSFIIESVKCLKPGGIFFHTTEFNLTSDSDTQDNTSSVFFRKQDMLKLEEMLNKNGAELFPINYSTGNKIPDLTPSGPPDYVLEPHLKVIFGGYTVTCIRLIGRKK